MRFDLPADTLGALSALIVSLTALFTLLFGSQWAARRRLWKQWKSLGRPQPPDNGIRIETAGEEAEDEEAGGEYLGEGRLLRPRGRRVRGTQEREIDFAEACMEVSARLRAGEATSAAWSATWIRITGQDPGDTDDSGVPQALAGLSGEVPQLVVAAIRFSYTTGAPLREVLEQAAGGLSDMERAQSAQKVAFAGPKMSARVLTALPLVGVLGAQVLGANPLTWIFTSPAGHVVGALGVAFTFAGHVVSRRMIGRAQESIAHNARAPLVADLLAAGLSGGLSIPAALEALGHSLPQPELVRVSRELRLGASWQEAFTPVPPGAALLMRGLQAAWEDGIFALGLLGQLATSARARSVTDAQVAAEKLSVKLALPLGALLLPAFVLLGLVPVALSLFGGQLVAP